MADLRDNFENVSPVAAGDAASPASAEPMQAPKRRTKAVRQPCVCCGRDYASRDAVRLDVIRPKIVDRIRSEMPDLPPDGFICRRDLDRFRSGYVSELLTHERGELTQIGRASCR